ncbi:MAG: recombination mediator RecR [Thermodesulfobacteriota bacterium]
MQYAEPILRLIKALSRLPGVGEKSATRMALFILNTKEGYVDELTGALAEVKEKVSFCSVCFTFSDVDPCGTCGDPARDPATVCVVSDYKDMTALEGMGGYRGAYHVLHGSLSPLKGVGPDDLRIGELSRRVASGAVREVILATGFDPEGEATSAYLAETLKPFGVKITRLATGVPVGGFVEYMDPATLGRALEGRHDFYG